MKQHAQADRRLRALLLVSSVVVGCNVILVPLLPAGATRPAHVLIQLAAVVCLAGILRHVVHRTRLHASAPTSAAGAAGRFAEALGGPFDGERVRLPAGKPAPDELRLRGVGTDTKIHRYVLEQPAHSACYRYRYRPPR